MRACVTSTRCVAFDLGVVGCVIHNNTDDLITSRYVIGVTQFLLNRNCLPTSLLTTESPPTRTVSTRSTSMSRMFWVAMSKVVTFAVLLLA